MAPNRDERSETGSEEIRDGPVSDTLFASLFGSESFREEISHRLSIEWMGNTLFGQRRDTSLQVILFASVLAAIIGPVVAITVGYSEIERWTIGNTYSLGQWVAGTGTGTGPSTVAIVGIGVLVALAAALAAKNSGLVPTIVLVMGPVFGIGLARYGMLIKHFSPSKLHRTFGITGMHFETVGPLQTLGTALFIAFVWGIPIGTLGFTLGALGRRGSDLVGLRTGGDRATNR